VLNPFEHYTIINQNLLTPVEHVYDLLSKQGQFYSNFSSEVLRGFPLVNTELASADSRLNYFERVNTSVLDNVTGKNIFR